MGARSKIILSVIGIAAVAVPAVFLITLTGSPTREPAVSSGGRQIDSGNIEDAVRRGLPSPSPIVEPSPTPEAEDLESTGSLEPVEEE